jgi:gliding motility-associated-like protein
MNRILLIITLLLTSLTVFGTHNRAGYITYRYIGPASSDTREYEITVTTCTKLSSTSADRPELQICWGDSKRDTVPRTSFIDDFTFDVRQNKYVYNHTYASYGSFTIEVYDPNRNADIINIVASINEPFCITTQIILSPFVGPNNSVLLDYCPCPEYACTFQPYCFNPGASDPDGDSLSFELVPCRGSKDCSGDRLVCCLETCPYMSPFVYSFPDAWGGPADIDPQSGSFCWNSPTIQGEYNIAIVVTEWRKAATGPPFKVGYVTLDYQLTVSGTCENNAPSLSEVKDTCIVAGTTLNFTVTATDPDPSDNLSMDAAGQPMLFVPDSATFTVPGNGTGNNLTGTFNWNTTCNHVSNVGYLVTFSVTDDDQGNTGPVQIPLSSYESFLVRVIPPQVTGVAAASAGNSIVVSWTPQLLCSGAAGYKIYRSNFPITNTENCCDGSTPTDLGYTYIGTVMDINSSTYTDNSSLSVGQNYCYVVVLFYDDGSVSCPSDPACAQLKAEFPIMTRVSIDVTDGALGTDTVEWFYPYELDTLVPPYNAGNFYYKLFRCSGLPGSTCDPTTLIHTTVISSSLPSLESVYFDSNLNTIAQQHTYKIELWHVSTTAVETFVGESTTANSIYLTLTPNDNQIGLAWQMNVPWTNSYYEVYKETPTGSGIFTMIDTTSMPTYVDTGLTNGATYCYRVKSIGGYTAPEIPTPLINWSQEACAAPIDLTAPCPPVLAIEGDCENILNTLTWNNPNNSCADDVMSYNIYYAETDTGSFTLINTVTVNSDTVFTHNNNGSIAGCYYVTAVDSAQYGNESVASNIVCIDNCPYYWLPNVFTPNGDGNNDLFVPFPYKFVKDIDLKVYNRWGNLVFETTDPDIKWNGISIENDKLLVEGVYYYVCKVNTIRLIGIEPVELHGFVHLFHDQKTVNK